MPRNKLMRQPRKQPLLPKLRMLQISKLLKLKKLSKPLKNQLLLLLRRIRQSLKPTKLTKQRKMPRKHLMMLNIKLESLIKLTPTHTKKLLKLQKPTRK
tara:strand:+ start:187 stop:483 length:297 start_codon:yes stop_codon:yes gene_type:complete